VLRVGQVCFVMWVIGDLVTSCHGVLAATERAGLGSSLLVDFISRLISNQYGKPLAF